MTIISFDHIVILPKYCFLSVRSSEGRAFFHFSLSPDFYELWRSVMSISLLTEVKGQWAMLVLGTVTVSGFCCCC